MVIKSHYNVSVTLDQKTVTMKSFDYTRQRSSNNALLVLEDILSKPICLTEGLRKECNISSLSTALEIIIIFFIFLEYIY